jgi:hypothetical protein
MLLRAKAVTLQAPEKHGCRKRGALHDDADDDGSQGSGKTAVIWSTTG